MAARRRALLRSAREDPKLLNDPTQVTALNETEWVPVCVEHIDKLLRQVDVHYTDVQLREALVHECEMDRAFVHYSDGFHHEQACEEFADKLVAARHKELHTAEDAQYQDWCAEFFQHKYPAAAPPPAEEPKPEKKVSNWWILFVLLFAVITIVAVTHIIRGR